VDLPYLNVSLAAADAAKQFFSFTLPFRIGRSDECEICIDNDYVSRVHVEVVFESGSWWIRDLNSSNGLYQDGRRVKSVPITRTTAVRLGIEGPQISFAV
jgi:membrane-bound lytic murein transglycosylase D